MERSFIWIKPALNIQFPRYPNFLAEKIDKSHNFFFSLKMMDSVKELHQHFCGITSTFGVSVRGDAAQNIHQYMHKAKYHRYWSSIDMDNFPFFSNGAGDISVLGKYE